MILKTILHKIESVVFRFSYRFVVLISKKYIVWIW